MFTFTDLLSTTEPFVIALAATCSLATLFATKRLNCQFRRYDFFDEENAYEQIDHLDDPLGNKPRWLDQRIARTVAYRITRNWHDAEEVASEATLRYLSVAGTPTNPIGYFRTCVVRTAFSYLRRRKRTLRHAPLPVEEIPDSGQDPIFVVDFQNALSELSPQCREVAILYFLHRLKRQEVAEKLGMSITTVNNRIHEAKGQLRQKLVEYRRSSRMIAG